jgi:hypothetical protein
MAQDGQNPKLLPITPSKISGYTWPEADAIDRWFEELGIEVDDVTLMKLKKSVSSYRIRVEKERDQFYETMYCISDAITGSEVEWTKMPPHEFRTVIRKWGKAMYGYKKKYYRIPKIFRSFWE